MTSMSNWAPTARVQKRRLSSAALAAVAAAVIGMPAAAWASDNPLGANTATTSTRASVTDPYGTTTTVRDDQGTGAINRTSSTGTTGGGVTMYVSLSPTGGVALTGDTVVGLDNVTTSGSASIIYDLEIVGPANTLATVDLLAHLQTSALALDDFDHLSVGTASASLVIQIPGQSTLIYQACAHGTGSSCTSPSELSIDAAFQAPTNQIIRVTEAVGVSASGDPSAAHALADPMFSLDSDFLGANPGADFELFVTPGVPNVEGGEPGVPEPATWALMILGLGAAGGAFRERRATRAA
jgi:hypothetical protein